MGFVLLNKNYSINNTNSEEYLTMLLLHEITHILGFSNYLYELYQYSGNITTTKVINGVNRTLLITFTVRDMASSTFWVFFINRIRIGKSRRRRFNRFSLGGKSNTWRLYDIY